MGGSLWMVQDEGKKEQRQVEEKWNADKEIGMSLKRLGNEIGF